MHPTQPPAARRARGRLREIVGQLRRGIAALEGLKAELPSTPEAAVTEMCDGLRPFDVPTMVRGAIDCAVEDGLGPAISALEAAARDTPESLEREWRRAERRAEAGAPARQAKKMLSYR